MRFRFLLEFKLIDCPVDPKSVDLQSTLEVNPAKGAQTHRVNKKREFKNKKYSMGGKRSGMKRNTKESAKEMGEFNPQKHQKRPGFKKTASGKKGPKTGGAKRNK